MKQLFILIMITICNVAYSQDTLLVNCIVESRHIDEAIQKSLDYKLQIVVNLNNNTVEFVNNNQLEAKFIAKKKRFLFNVNDSSDFVYKFDTGSFFISTHYEDAILKAVVFDYGDYKGIDTYKNECK